MCQFCCLYEIWLSESSGLITELVDGQMQQDKYLSSVVTPICIQIDSQNIIKAIIEAMLIILKITK